MADIAPLVWSSLKDIAASTDDAVQKAGGGIEPTKEEFLRLFMAQLKNQDPLSPMEQKDMTAQLATFTSLEKQIEGNRALGEIRDSLRGQEGWFATSWVGKDLRIDASCLTYSGDGEVPLHYRLPEGTASCQVRVLDEKDQLVKSFETIDLPEGGLAGGGHLLTWDGRNHRGQAQAAGTYRVEIDALGENGQPLPGATTDIVARLDGVEMEAGRVRLKIAGQKVRPQDVLEVL